MARYLHYYENQAAFEREYNGGYYEEPWTSYIGSGDREVRFDRASYDELRKMPLTFEILEDGYIYVNYDGHNDDYTREVYWKVNDGEWDSDTPDNGYSIEIEVEAGDEVQFCGYEDFMSIRDGSSYEYYTYFGSDCLFKAKGNIMSLLDGSDFENMTEFPDDSITGIFAHLFYDCEFLVDAYDLILPAQVLTNYCYYGMFSYCGIKKSPEFPATTLAEYCYHYMFDGCTSLVQAPELPATELVGGCYHSMFMRCTSLTQAPTLPATALANNCYGYMFQDCTSLTAAPELPATTLANYCYVGMFRECTNLTTAPVLPPTTLANGCYNQMFQDCTSLITAPELPATILVSWCYYEMFQGCTNLNYIKCLAKNISAGACLTNWVTGVQTTSGTFVKAASMSSWPSGVSGIPNNWTIVNA